MRFTTPFQPRLFALLLAALSVLMVVAACSNDSESKSDQPAPTPAPVAATPSLIPKKMTFMAGFKAQANLPFVAAYVAEKKGYFAEQALDVTIRHAASGEHLKLLVDGEIQVTTADAGSVLRRRSDPDVPIRAIALFGQKGQNAYMVMERSGMRTPKDWEGKTFGYKTSVPPEYLAILKATGVDRSKIREVRVGFDPRVLSEGQVDILAVFNSNEPNVLQKLGLGVRVFNPDDYGVPTLGLTFIAIKERLDADPDLYTRFVKATLKGLQFAIDPKNEEETLNIIMQYAPQEDREHQRFMMREELRNARGPVTEQLGLGAMADAQWKGLYDQLIEFQALPKPFDYRTAYDDRFVKAANGR